VTGELGDGWLPTILDVDDYARCWAGVRGGAVAAGRDPDAIVAGMWRYVVVAADHETSHRIVEHPMVKALLLALPASYFESRGHPHPLGSNVYGFLEYVPAALGRDDAIKAIDAIPSEVAHDAILHGTPADLAQAIEPYARAGLRHIALWNVSFFADVGHVGPSYKLLTEAKDEIKQLGF
jgi:alkanesulfonate monooxygenase SsuD/methylene tetrahydromethanopterin reductase-like flavin-dependent oxidoreductase (luciferase family)